MRFYDAYPMMRPYIGERYRSATTRLLLVGESHYLPQNATQHLTPAAWYGGSNETLSAKEITWISTAPILESAVASRFKLKSHVIWKNAFEAINAAGPRYPEAHTVANDIAFYNFFLRPARTGLSLRCEKEDVELANEAFAIHYADLAPTAVIFISMLAHRHARVPDGAVGVATAHPASPWWHRKSKTRGNKSGQQVVLDFVSKTPWL